MIQSILNFSFPLWPLLLFFLAFFFGRLWQWEKDREEAGRLYELLAEMTRQIDSLSLGQQPGPVSSLARAIIHMGKVVTPTPSIPATCLHGDHPDDCPICRH